MNLFLQTTPDTSLYMIMGYGIIFSVMLLYLASMWVRRKNLKRDYEMLKEIEQQKRK